MAEKAAFELEESPPYPELAWWEEKRLEVLEARARGGGLRPLERMELQALAERKRRVRRRTKPDRAEC